MFTPSRKFTQYYYFLFVKIVWSFFFQLRNNGSYNCFLWHFRKRAR